MNHRTAMARRHQRPAGFLLSDAPDFADWPKVLERLDGAYSPHTLLSYHSDFSSFEAWCRGRNLRFLPTEPSTVAAYLAAETARLKPSTLKRKLAGIRKIHYLFRLGDPTSDVEVDLAIRRARRLKPQRPDQALGITADLRDRLLAACGPDLTGFRDRALVAVGFDTLCRRSELVALRAEDLQPNHFGTASLTIRRAKNDPEGTGRIAHLSPLGLNALQAWMNVSDIDHGPLFRPVYRRVAISRHLNPFAVTRILKKLAATAGMDVETVERISGHSLRVGAAQQLTMNGVQLLPLMRAGGWRSTNIVARYVENVDMNVWA